MCNIRSNVSLCLLEKFSMGNPGTFWLIFPKLHGLETSNFFLGNGCLISKTILCTVWLVLPWMVTCMKDGIMGKHGKLRSRYLMGGRNNKLGLQGRHG